MNFKKATLKQLVVIARSKESRLKDRYAAMKEIERRIDEARG